MLAGKDVKALSREICLAMAKIIKNITGRGPITTEVFIQEKFVLIRLAGFILPVETKMAESPYGYYLVKMNRMEWAETYKDHFIETISELLNRKAVEFFCDGDPVTDTGVMIFFFE